MILPLLPPTAAERGRRVGDRAAWRHYRPLRPRGACGEARPLAESGVRAADWLPVVGVSGGCDHVAPEARSGPRWVGRCRVVIGRRCPAPRGDPGTARWVCV